MEPPFTYKEEKNMKKQFILTMALGLMLCSCGGDNTPVFEDFNDSYVEKLPDNAQDGLTFHAFNWTFNQIKDNLPYLAEAGFKNILTMPVQQPKGGGSSWWAYYQPLSFSIADNSAIGTKDELKALCDKAEEYNMAIMVDVVANHMANINDEELEADGTPKVSPSVEAYEPELYSNRNASGDAATFHHNPNATGSGAETQVYPWGKLPDLNTANPVVQERVYSLLKECIDVGVDGFRFDAAKHIETSDDPDYASNFWENTLDKASTYYTNLTGKQLYAYGEILNSPEGRTVDVYTKHMDITDDGFAAQYKGAWVSKDSSGKKNGGEKIASATYKTDASKQITWVESHDDFTSSDSHLSENRTNAMWSVIAGRKDLGGLYLGRPNDSNSVGVIGSYAFDTPVVRVANSFHNRFVGSKEYQSGEGALYVNERINDKDQGALVLNVDKIDSTQEITVKLPHLDDGNYYDALTGEKVVVYNHSAKIKFDKVGVSFLTRKNAKVIPSYTVSKRSGSFASDLEITVTASNYETATYSFNDETTTKELSSSTKISLKDHVKDGKVVLNISLKNGDYEIKRSFTYSKVELLPGGFNVINMNPKYLTDYELYMWSWGNDNKGKWSKDYTVTDNGTILVDATNLKGFLFGIFEKGYEIKNVNAWDSEVKKQTSDIVLENGFYDASNF
jgi:alpha-amylase